MIRKVPFLKILAFGQVLLLARRHLRGLDKTERRRLMELGRKGTALSAAERAELRELISKFETKAFMLSAADKVSPVPLPRWLVAKLR